jgi:dethiobiotin synthetase
VKGAFITATGTGVGKTWLASAFAAACVQRGRRVAAIKPIETGVDQEPLDAVELARACNDEALARADGLYRAKEPLAPYAIEKRGGPSVGSLRALAKRVRELGSRADYAIVEGAGGVLVPLDRDHTIADLAALLDLPAVLVARNELGVLSYTLTAVEALRKRNVSVRAIVLNHVDRHRREDVSRTSNADVLADYLPRVPILRAPRVKSPTDMLDTGIQLCNILKV